MEKGGDLEVRSKETERSDRVELLDGVHKPIAAEGARVLAGLDPEAGSRVECLNNNDARRVDLLKPDGDGLKKWKINQQTSKSK